VKPDYYYTNPFYQNAKHRFLYDEPEDFAQAFDYAYNDMIQHTPEKEQLPWRDFLNVHEGDQFMGGISGQRAPNKQVRLEFSFFFDGFC
jgi:hypothetical protein